MDFIQSLLTGIVSGIVASLLFCIYMYQMRPRIVLCDKIVRFKRDGKKYFGFKLYNNSMFFSVLELRIEVILQSPFNTDGGTSYRNERITLKSEKYMILPRKTKRDSGAGYALVVTTTDDIDTKWSEDSQRIVFRVYGRHPFSGASKSFYQTYYVRKSIHDGMFSHGATKNIN